MIVTPHSSSNLAHAGPDPLWFCTTPEAKAARHAAIAENAYFRAQHRGFEPGHELDDWLAAEQETDTADVACPC